MINASNSIYGLNSHYIFKTKLNVGMTNNIRNKILAVPWANQYPKFIPLPVTS